jgi:hypothetical protein
VTTPTAGRRLSRAEQQAMPLALAVAEEVATLHGVCIRPIELKRLDTHTGQIEHVDVPCGATREAKCPACAKRNRQLRMAQCRQGWHLDHEPLTEPDPSTEEQRWLIEFRADVQAQRDQAATVGEDVSGWDEAIAEIDADINAAGMRGNVTGGAPLAPGGIAARRRPGGGEDCSGCVGSAVAQARRHTGG